MDQSFFQQDYSFEQLDDAIWKYLCGLIPDGATNFREKVAKMLNSVTPELKRYYLVRSFDWERGSSGLEGCMIREEDDMFIQETIQAYEELGAKEHAGIIRELIPIAEHRWEAIDEADAIGDEFDYDDDPFEAFESKWDDASDAFDFYEVIFKEIKHHPEKYFHP